jgi:hypothetical protein
MSVVADEGAGTHTRGDEALAAESVVGDRDRRAGDVQPPRQLSTRWQTVTRSEPAVEDRVAQLPVDLAGETHSSDQADVEVHRRQRTDDQLAWSSSSELALQLVLRCS